MIDYGNRIGETVLPAGGTTAVRPRTASPEVPARS